MKQTPNHFQFVAVGSTVKRGAQIVCRAPSGKIARLIAEALNSLTRRRTEQ